MSSESVLGSVFIAREFTDAWCSMISNVVALMRMQMPKGWDPPIEKGEVRADGHLRIRATDPLLGVLAELDVPPEGWCRLPAPERR